MHYTHKLEAITQLKDLPRSLSGTPRARESHTHTHIIIIQTCCAVQEMSRTLGAHSRQPRQVQGSRTQSSPSDRRSVARTGRRPCTRKHARPRDLHLQRSHRSHRQLTRTRMPLAASVSLAQMLLAAFNFEPPAPKAAQTKATRTAGAFAHHRYRCFWSRRCDWSVGVRSRCSYAWDWSLCQTWLAKTPLPPCSNSLLRWFKPQLLKEFNKFLILVKRKRIKIIYQKKSYKL